MANFGGRQMTTCVAAITRWITGRLVLVSAAMLFADAAVAAEAVPMAVVFASATTAGGDSLEKDITDLVKAAGYEVSFVDADTLASGKELTAQKVDLLVLPRARSLPAAAVAVVSEYLKHGGDVLALGLPAWESPTFEVNGRWMTRTEYEQALGKIHPQHVLFDFGKVDLDKWTPAADDSTVPAKYEVVPADGGKALHVVIARYPGWETFASPPLTKPFAAGQTLTCFRAKGGANTKQLAIEWTERDGSRWIATVDLTPEWKDYALPPAAFKPWQPPPARAGKDDHLRVENAVRLVVGVAQSHTALEGKRHEYWLADIGTAANPLGDAPMPGEFAAPHLESLSPGYLFYPIRGDAKNAVTIEAVGVSPTAERDEANEERGARSEERVTRSKERDASATRSSFLAPHGFWPVSSGDAAGSLYGIHPRPRGVGFKQEREYRWQPLLAARDSANGDYRGAIAALLVHAKGPYAGGVWAAFTPAEREFYRQPVVAKCLQQTLTRMRRGVFLVEGGAEFFTVFPRQSFAVGAQIVNTGKEKAIYVSVVIETKSKDGAKPRVLKQATILVDAGATAVVDGQAMLAKGEDGTVQVTLSRGGETIDSLSHEIGVWQLKPQPEFVEARDGGLWLGGRPWKAHGVNYMPSSGIGLDNWRHFEQWVGRGAYDPEVIERDLRRIKAMNLNAVSAFVYYDSLRAQHMLDFLRRCEAHGIKVNLSLRPGTPLDFRWEEMREIIGTLRLPQNDTVFAYDLAWEPHHERQALKTEYAQPWQAWIEKRYGSVAAAKQAWTSGVQDSPFKLDDSQIVPAPPIEWFTQDGPWRRVIADYRKFLDDMLGEKYAEARRLVKSIDPHHAVSFRMQHAGDPTYNSTWFLAYDFAGLSNAVDIWEPEAYGRIGDWEKVKPGRFTASYARLCDAAKPVVWAEVGESVWDNLHMSPAAAKLDFQARYFRDFYRMLNESGADGVVFWWYPGGYRLNERSDFGIIAPDGTDRPATKVIREEGAKFLEPKKVNIKPDSWIAVDRDRDARGLFGIYEAAKAEYWQAIANGKTPGLKWVVPPKQ